VNFAFSGCAIQRMTDKQFDIITFDCYGTLIDWESGIKAAFHDEAARDGVELDGNQIIAVYSAEEPAVESAAYRPYREVLAETTRRVAGRLGWELKPEHAGFLAASLPDWKPFADTNPALERLARRFELGILSNIDDDLLTATRRHFTVGFDFVVTAQQVASYKPGLSHFTEALSRARSRRLLHAAQSYFHDVVPATRLGIPVVWVNRNGSLVEPDGPLPNHEVRDLTELANLLGV
jgi:2-haloacid dehalogenase/putative hydrolase of the HAD superfamily